MPTEVLVASLETASLETVGEEKRAIQENHELPHIHNFSFPIFSARASASAGFKQTSLWT